MAEDKKNQQIIDHLSKIEDKTLDSTEAMPVLEKTEKGIGALLKYLSKSSIRRGIGVARGVTRAIGMKKESYALGMADRALRGVSVFTKKGKAERLQKEAPGAKTATKGVSGIKDASRATAKIMATSAVKKAAIKSEKATLATTAKRGTDGRFVAKEKKSPFRDENGDAKGLGQIMRDGFARFKENKGGSIKDILGKSLFGPLYDIGGEIKELVQDSKDANDQQEGTWHDLKKWTKAKAGIKDKKSSQPDKQKIAPKQKPEKKTPAKMPETKVVVAGGGGDGILDDVLGKAGGKAIGKLGPTLAKVGPIMAGLGTSLLSFAGPAAAVAAAGAAGWGIGTILNKGINKVTEMATGEKGATLGGKVYDIFHGDTATQFETGKGKTAAQAAATISTGAGDHGGKSYGSYQLSSKQGEVDKFLKSSGYADKFQGMQVGSKDFDAKWKDLAANDTKFAESQKQYAGQTKYAPQMNKLKKGGVDLSGRGKAVQEMVLSTANQYGAGTDVIQKALEKKLQPGETVAGLSDAQVIKRVQEYKGETVGQYFKSSNANVQAGVAKRTQDEKGVLLQMANQEAIAGGKPVVAAKEPPAPEPAKPVQVAKAEPVKKQESVAEPTRPTEKAKMAKAEPPPAQTAKAAPKAEMAANEPVKTATPWVNPDGAGRPVAQKPDPRYASGKATVGLDGAFRSVLPDIKNMGVGSLQQGLAKQMPTMPQLDTRSITSTVAKQMPKLPPQIAPMPSFEAPALNIKGFDQLVAGLAPKETKKTEKATDPTIPVIRTEFDDTTLTLMAYDRT